MPEYDQRWQQLLAVCRELTEHQLGLVEDTANLLRMPVDFTIKQDGYLSDQVARDFGDVLKLHHAWSSEPFSKDKFEYALVRIFKLNKFAADLAEKGNPGHDATVRAELISLKTQADRNIREDVIWISKFMELGSGEWSDNPDDLKGLLAQFLDHLKRYDRVFTLRALLRGVRGVWKYELVEIPKAVFEKAKDGELKMMLNSKQTPKPGYCRVKDQKGKELYCLYFDGGGERKLQIKGLLKSLCTVHATWSFTVPTKPVEPGQSDALPK